MAVFLDTSALAKLYHQEQGSDTVERVVQQSGPCVLSRLGVLEMHSVIALKQRAAGISVAGATAILLRFREDVRRRRFRVAALRGHHYEAAETLIGLHGPRGLRTLDSLQLASALDLQRQKLIDSIVTADRVLSGVSMLEGLTVIYPGL